MSRMLLPSVLLALTLFACDDPPKKPAPTSPPPTWHRDIAPLVKAKCEGCHVEGGIAPFALQTYAQVFALRDAVRASVELRSMPPWPPDADCTDYQQVRALSVEQILLLSRWVEEGAPEGDPSEAPAEPAPTANAGGLSRVDARLEMPLAYTPQQRPDEYRCFLMDWPYTDVRYVTGIRGEPGNAAIVHHLIAFVARPDQVAKAQALDEAEAGPGYTCFGGPGLNDDRAGWLGTWVPGSLGMDFPEGTGLRVEPGSKVILQVHYNQSGTRGGSDRSAFALKTDSTVEKQAFLQPWANPTWVSKPETMRIPAGQRDTVHTWKLDPTPYLSNLTGGVYPNNTPITVYSVALHQHTLGTSSKLEIVRRSGAKECLLDIPRWDFHWQGQYPLAQPKVLNPGDSLALECHWDNSALGAVDVNWGEGTGDEMCLGVFYMTQ